MSFSLEKCQKNEQGQPICRTKDGRSVRIVCTDLRAIQPIVAAVSYEGRESLLTYSKDGRWTDELLPNDLENIPQRVKRWVTIYPNGTAFSYSSEDHARRMSCDKEAIAIAVPVEFEVRG